MHALLVSLLLAIGGAGAGEPASSPTLEAPVPVVVPEAPPVTHETCTLRPFGRARRGRAAAQVGAVWEGARLAVHWLPQGAAEATVHVAGDAWKRAPVQLVCTARDDGTLLLDDAALTKLDPSLAPPWVAVVQTLGDDDGDGAIAWVRARRRPVAPLRFAQGVDPALRRHLRAAAALEGVAIVGAAWGTAVGVAGVFEAYPIPRSASIYASGPSIPLEAALIGTDVSLRKAHRRLAELGHAVPRGRLRVAEGLQYSGLALQLAAAIAGFATNDGVDRAEGAAIFAPQAIGAALQLSSAIVYDVDRARMQRLAATITPTVGGATIGVEGAF